jgi:hypothetical protein
MEPLDARSKSHRYTRRRRRYELAIGTLAAVGGGGLGAVIAGPWGLAIGAAIGAGAGGLAGWAAQRGDEEAAQRDSQLDIEIGVVHGDIGAPGLEHPPPKIGAFSREVSGTGGVAPSAPASGPFLRPPE